jgi:hypothetical protein
VLTQEQVLEIASHLRGQLDTERNDLDVLRRYVTGRQALPLVVPRDAPAEVRELARISRINLIAIVVNSLVESLYVDNIRMTESPGPARNELGSDAPLADAEADDPDEAIKPIWDTWQKNRMDKGQSGLYRAVFTYGYGYMVATPGAPVPLVRPVSPRRLTTMYGNNPEYPVQALEWRRDGSYRLYALDPESGMAFAWALGYDKKAGKFGTIGDPMELGLPYLPVVKYVGNEDLDTEDEPDPMWWEGTGGPAQNRTTMVMTAGEVAPLMTLQDQTDVSSFALKSAEWYTAFRQRWVVGWTPENKTAKMQSAASQMWTFDEDPDAIKLGEFSETSLDGFLRSREAVLKYAATLSQTPVHELIGELVNLSAEALAAAEAGRDRKVELCKTSLGESHEQLTQVIGDLGGYEVPDDVETVWRDTSARAFGAIIDGLGKVAQMLNVPAEMLWDRIPGVTRQDVERWKARAKEGDSMQQLTALLGTQANPGTPPAGTPSGLLLPNGQPAPRTAPPAPPAA